MQLSRNVLAIDDNASFLMELRQALDSDFMIKTVTSVPEAMKLLVQAKPDLILLDMNMPQVSGLEFLKVLRLRHPELPVIMLTSESKPEIIVETMRAGASDYVVKSSEDLIPSLRIRISQSLKLKKQHEVLSTKAREAMAKYEIKGVSSSTIKLRSDITRYKGTDSFVVILGENGTGKELVARNLNLQENDPARPFVAVNCGAIPSPLFESVLFGHVKGAFTGAVADQMGKFVLANGGDLFLDEIGDLPLEMQVKLLRVLQDGAVNPVGSNKMIDVNVRVIAATNQKLEELVREGKFRQDLYFRLNQIILRTAPLRERNEDILFLAKIFAEKSLPGITISKDAVKALETHTWPGNIRELENTIDRACIMVRGTSKPQILPEHLTLADLNAYNALAIPPRLLPQSAQDVNPQKYQQCFDWIERIFLERGLDLLKGDNGSLIEKLAVSKSHYYRRKKALGISEVDELGAI